MVRRLLIIARRLVESGWFVILPVAVVIGLVLVLNASTARVRSNDFSRCRRCETTEVVTTNRGDTSALPY